MAPTRPDPLAGADHRPHRQRMPPTSAREPELTTPLPSAEPAALSGMQSDWSPGKVHELDDHTLEVLPSGLRRTTVPLLTTRRSGRWYFLDHVASQPRIHTCWNRPSRLVSATT